MVDYQDPRSGQYQGYRYPQQNQNPQYPQYPQQPQTRQYPQQYQQPQQSVQQTRLPPGVPDEKTRHRHDMIVGVSVLGGIVLLSVAFFILVSLENSSVFSETSAAQAPAVSYVETSPAKETAVSSEYEIFLAKTFTEPCLEQASVEDRRDCLIKQEYDSKDYEGCAGSEMGKSYCLKLLALEKNSTDYCDVGYASESGLKEECYKQVASEAGNPGACSIISDPSTAAQCYLNVATETADYSLCNKIAGSLLVKQCLFTVALKHSLPDACNEIPENSTIYSRAECLDALK